VIEQTQSVAFFVVVVVVEVEVVVVAFLLQQTITAIQFQLALK
jgi:hypothetical protein